MERNIVALLSFFPIALKHLAVDCKVNIWGGFLYKAVEKRDLQFHPSVPLFTSNINCFSLSFVSNRLNSCNSSFETSEWFSTILLVSISNHFNISFSNFSLTSFNSEIFAVYIAILGSFPSTLSSPYLLQNSDTTSFKKSSLLTSPNSIISASFSIQCSIHSFNP